MSACRLAVALSVLLSSAALTPGAVGQDAVDLHGSVLDADTEAPLAGATVQAIELERGTVTDAQGRFALPGLQAGSYTVLVRYVGYRPFETSVFLPTPAPLEVRLNPITARSDDVVVTASPWGSTVRYQATQAYSREMLQRRSATSFGEVLDGEPGLAMRSFGPAPARPVLRGFDGDRLVVLENGERSGDLAETAADHAISMDPLAADRIEVVRGPASLLYGTGAIGGVVNVLSDDLPHRWDRGWAGDLAIQAASVNRQGAAFGRFRYGGDTWAATSRVAARFASDMRTPEGVLPETDLQNVDLGVGIAYRSGGASGALFGSFLERVYGIPEAIDDPDARVEIRMQRQSLQGQARWGVDGFFQQAELRVLAARYGHEEVEIEDGEEDLELSYLQSSISATVLATHRAWGPFAEGAVGASAFVREVSVGGDEALTPDGFAATGALFAIQVMPLSGTLSLQTGLRGEVTAMSIRPNELFPEVVDSRTTPTLSMAVGLNHRPSSELEFGLQVAQAFRISTIEERYSDAAHIGAGAYEIGDPNLGTERALGADAFGIWKSAWLRLEVAAFYLRIVDYVAYRPSGEVDGPSGLPVFTYEAQNAQMIGGELQAAVAPVEGVRVTLTTDAVRGSRLADGVALPQMPPPRARLATEVDRGLWWVGTSARGVAAQRRVDPNERASEGYVLLGMEGGLRLSPSLDHIVSLRVDNVLDTAYRDHLSRVQGRDAPMPGRNVALTYRVMW